MRISRALIRVLQLVLGASVVGTLLLFPAVAGAASPTLTQFPVPTGNSQPEGITTGGDGNVWFTEFFPSAIGRITPAGVVTEFSDGSGGPERITQGPNGNLWFAQSNNGAVGQITTGGSITIETLLSANKPVGIASGPDGNIWFTEGSGAIGRDTTSGSFTAFAVPTATGFPVSITAGSDSNLWFTERDSGKIGRITTAGAVTEFSGPGSGLGDITSGPDGNLWFAEFSSGQIGRITPSGAITEFPLPDRSGGPVGITSGPDGALWFTERSAGRIGRITTSGVITETPIATAGSQPVGITTGPDGNLWFAETVGDIGRMTPSAPPWTPLSDSAPTISGTTTEGQPIGATAGAWSNAPTTFAYQWQDCDASGAGCTNTPGATAATYTTTDADVGHTLRVVVTAANGAGPSSSTSAPSSVIAAVPLPTATTGQGSAVSQTTAVLNAQINPNGSQVTSCQFDWGTSVAYGASAPCAQVVGAGTSAIAVSSALSGLSPGTAYHFRIVATNIHGTAAGLDQVTTTLPAASGGTRLTPSSVTVGCAPTSVQVGQSTTCTGTVSGGSTTPSGTLSFSAPAGDRFGGDGCLLSGGGGSASCSITFTPTRVGTSAVTATYAGDAAHSAANASTQVLVTAASRLPNAITLSCTSGVVGPGESTICTATVSGGADGPDLTGAVGFTSSRGGEFDNGGRCLLSGHATTEACSVRFKPPGAWSGTISITATYGGDAFHAATSTATTIAASPTAGSSGDLGIVKGTVLITLPGGQRFSPAPGTTLSIPIGATIDARKGVVRISTAADYLPARSRHHRVQNGTFSAGMFTIKQMTAKRALELAKAHHHHLTGGPPTDLVLTAPKGAARRAACRRTGPPGKGIVRSITGVAKGLYRTVGAASTTTTRNASWTVQDRCDGTLTRVKKGHATVTTGKGRHRRTVNLRSGQTFIAPGRFLQAKMVAR